MMTYGFCDDDVDTNAQETCEMHIKAFPSRISATCGTGLRTDFEWSNIRSRVPYFSEESLVTA